MRTDRQRTADGRAGPQRQQPRQPTRESGQVQALSTDESFLGMLKSEWAYHRTYCTRNEARTNLAYASGIYCRNFPYVDQEPTPSPDNRDKAASHHQGVTGQARSCEPSSHANNHTIVHLRHSGIVFEIEHITWRKLGHNERAALPPPVVFLSKVDRLAEPGSGSIVLPVR
jgi:hypothetical protein